MAVNLSHKLTDLWFANEGNFLRIRSFRTCAIAGIVPAATQSFQRGLRLPKVLDKDGWVFPDRERALSEEFALQIAESLAKSSAESNQAVIDSASLVFAHSIVDDIATECCRLSSLAHPQGWREVIGKKQVPLADIAASGYEAVYAAKLAEHVDKDIAKRSLPDRAAIINSRCQPLGVYRRFEISYTFDPDRLLKLDRLRHEIVHDLAITKSIENMDDELQFMNSTSEFLIWSINQKYRIGLDWEYWRQTIAARAAGKV